MNHKLLMAMVFILSIASGMQAQSGLTSLSNLYVTITAPGDTTAEIEATQYASDTGSVPERVQLNVELDISAPASLHHIVLKYGTNEGYSDILNMELTMAQLVGTYYLHYSGWLFALQSGRATIRRLVPSSTLATPCYLRIEGYDTNSTATNVLTMSNIQ
jgi:hypothetical protein